MHSLDPPPHSCSRGSPAIARRIFSADLPFMHTAPEDPRLARDLIRLLETLVILLFVGQSGLPTVCGSCNHHILVLSHTVIIL